LLSVHSPCSREIEPQIMFRLCVGTVGTHRGRVHVELSAKLLFCTQSQFTCLFYLSLYCSSLMHHIIVVWADFMIIKSPRDWREL